MTRVSRRLGMSVAATALTLSVLSFDSGAIAGQVQWKEVPAPTGDRAIARSFPTAFRTDTIDIPIRGNDGDLEYKIAMKTGDTVVYSWEVMQTIMPEELYSEFHGHTEPVGGTGTLMYYRKATGTRDHGTHPAKGSLSGMPSRSTSVRPAPFGPMLRRLTPCAVGFATRLLDRRKSEKPGAEWRRMSVRYSRWSLNGIFSAPKRNGTAAKTRSGF